MITITGIDGRKHHLHRDAVARISESPTSSAWHGIRSLVKTFDGEVIEAQEAPKQILAELDKEGA
jgi:uncharacterized protein YlzI (FlbEa/FlbD family)